MKKYSFFLLFTLSTIVGFSQSEFRAEIDRIYNFHPQKLTRDEQQKLFPVLDAFFEKVKSDQNKYLPLLREELLANDHFPYFYFDGAHLLMMLSEARTDKEIAAAAFAKADVRDLDPRMFVILLKSLASDGVNVTKAAMKILDEPGFSFFVPQHAMEFGQGYCLTYALLHLSPDMYVGELIRAFRETTDAETQKSIITTLWFTYSCNGDEFLRSLNAKNTLSKDVSAYAAKILGYDKVPKDYEKMLKTSTPKDLEKMKAAALNRFTDEAILELDFVTKARRKKQACL